MVPGKVKYGFDEETAELVEMSKEGGVSSKVSERKEEAGVALLIVAGLAAMYLLSRKR